MLKWVIVAIGATAVSVIAGWICLPHLPDSLAIHWDWQDQPNNFLPKGLAIVLLPMTSLISLPALAGLHVLARRIGHPPYTRALRRAGGGIAACLAFLTVFLQGLTLAWNLGVHWAVGWATVLPGVAVALGILVLGIAPVMKLDWSASREAGKGLPPGLWFPAKRFGWGWGLPCAWQGWVVILAWLVLVVVGLWACVRTAPQLRAVPLCAIFALLMAALLLGVCFWKGEKPRWRWGNSDEPQR